ncbi:MAG: hypothetical protein WCG84_02695 [Candidatus Moraniibacteriota bacterium]
MKYLSRIFLFVSVVFLGFGQGGLSMAMVSGEMTMPHQAMEEDAVAGMHRMENVPSIGSDSTMPACASDMWCFLNCQQASVVTSTESQSEHKLLVNYCEQRDTDTVNAFNQQSFFDSSGEIFSPPQDPSRLLSLLKRE